jgi:hypothetical protein
MSGVLRWLLACVLGTSLPLPAAAWCRSTTCKGEACATNAEGCIIAGKPLGWNRRCIGYSVQVGGTNSLPEAAVRDAVRKAFGTWSTVVCPNGKPVGLHLAELAPTPCGNAEYDPQGPNVNAILFRDGAWSYKGIENNVAKTTAHYDPATGVIHDADIEVNTANNHYTVGDGVVKYDLQTVLTHEIGHFLGLAHSPNPWAVMSATYEPGSLSGRELDADDIEAICALYPPDGSSAVCDYTPEGGEDRCDGSHVASACSMRRSAPAAAGLWLLSTAAGLLCWRRWA